MAYRCAIRGAPPRSPAGRLALSSARRARAERDRAPTVNFPRPVPRHPHPIVNLPSPDIAPTIDLRDRVIVVTGATGGLGSAVAKALAARGATVVLHGRTLARIESVYDQIVAAGGPEPVILPLDFARAGGDDFANVSAALESQFQRLDGLVHTAAMLGSLGPMEHQSFDAWLALLRVNVAAPMGMTRAVIPLLARAPDAAVVFTLDDRGVAPRAYWGGYGVTKAAVAALARELADEWENRPNLRVDAVVPGPIRSPMRGRTHPGEDRSRLPAPEALAPLYVHLLRGRAKADSGALIDAGAWLSGSPASSPLVA